VKKHTVAAFHAMMEDEFSDEEIDAVMCKNIAQFLKVSV